MPKGPKPKQSRQKYCCDPIQKHKSKIYHNVFVIKEELAKESLGILQAGNFLCSNCHYILKKNKDIFKEIKSRDHLNEENEALDEVQMEGSGSDSSTELKSKIRETAILESVLPDLEESPVKLHGLTPKQKEKKAEKKLRSASAKLKEGLESAYNVQLTEEEKFNEADIKEYDSCKQVMANLVKAFHTPEISYEKKLHILQLSPYSIEKTAQVFGATQYMVRRSRDLIKKYGLMADPPKISRGKVITKEMKNYVKGFYNSDEISRQCPGKKDYVSMKNDLGEKMHVQKRLILMSLKEAFEKLKDEIDRPEISFSSFASLRPKNCILPGAKGTHTVCVCTHHQNVKLMIHYLGQKNVGYKDLLKTAVCDIENPDCMLGSCRNCPGKEGVLEFLSNLDLGDREDISYRQWVSTDRCNLIDKISSIEEYFDILSDKIKKLTRHHYISKVQGEYLKELKTRLGRNEAIILGDYSENYSFLVQDAVQGHHWDNSQATVHPFVMYSKTIDGSLEHQSFCFISPDLTHSTLQFHTFLDVLVPYIKINYPHINLIHYFTDGCAGQYKNKYNFMLICQHFKRYGLRCSWNFFATSHGKNSCDGIGGTVKRAVANESLKRPFERQILTAMDMFTFCDDEFITEIKFFYISHDDVKCVEERVNPELPKALTISGTRKYHKFVPINESEIKVFDTSKDEIGEVKYVIRKEGRDFVDATAETSTKINDYVAVTYTYAKWIGIVTSYDEEFDDFEIHFLNPSGPSMFYTFSENEKCYVPRENILGTLKSPTLKAGTSRIQYKFSENDIKNYLM